MHSATTHPLAMTQRISATPRGARLARHLATAQLAAWGIPHDTEPSQAAAAIVAELAANAVTHGRVAGRDFELGLHLDGATLRIAVSDARTEKQPPRFGEAPAPEAETGRGLLLVQSLATAWGVTARDIGKTVWAELHVSTH
ncbi:ATP-binding protein [Streptomyces sp. NBC_01304]|uniref:ATP-binding protein n=1 Tax=Streptomyces sp. NBC_01304 TaxID=2903818 RepID=UPI002E163BC2|nr:ATP-binding protein [Streptomyces sp. NBC_01304]